MRVLLFDSNVVAAKRLGHIVEQHVQGAEVEYASNLEVLEHRVSEKTYDFVLADIDATLELERATAILRSIQEKSIVYLFSQIGNADWLRTLKENITGRVMLRPRSARETALLLNSVS